MTLEGIEWLLMLMVVSFILGAVFGKKLLQWFLRVPQSFLRPSYLTLVGYLKTDKGKSKISRRP